MHHSTMPHGHAAVQAPSPPPLAAAARPTPGPGSARAPAASVYDLARAYLALQIKDVRDLAWHRFSAQRGQEVGRA
jgi:hypothetical protein